MARMATCTFAPPSRVQNSHVQVQKPARQKSIAIQSSILHKSPFQGNRSAFLHSRRVPVTAAKRRNSPQASLTFKEPSTGVEFPLVQSFWLGEAFRCMGAAARAKKIAFIAVKVYAVSLYVEAEKAAKELGVRDRGGFFENDDDFCQALIDGGFIKVLQVQLVRKVDGAQFVEALSEALEPRMRLTGEMSILEQFKSFFEGKELEKGTNIFLMYRTDATLDVILRQGDADYTKVVAGLSIPSASLCRALFEVYLGSNSVVPEACKEWANGARALLDSEKVRRDSRKGGSG